MLTVKRPSPTTVLYTVSTRSSTDTFTAQFRRSAIGLARILAGLVFVCVFVAKVHDLLPSRWKLPLALFDFLPSALLARFSAVPLSEVSGTYVFPTCLAIVSLAVRKGYTSESLLVIRGLGVQTSTSSPTYLSTATTRFIPTNMIQDIFIHEAFKGFEVRFYLNIVVEGEHDVVVVFPSILPGRHVLEQVWRGARSCLYEPKT